MKRSKAELKGLLMRDQFPKVSSYDPAWVIENQM